MTRHNGSVDEPNPQPESPRPYGAGRARRNPTSGLLPSASPGAR
jgi:hypothetical protein